MVSDVFFEGDSVVVDVDLEFEVIVFRKWSFEFVTTGAFVLKGCDQGIGVNGVVS